MSGEVQDYRPPQWATQLTSIPRNKINLAVPNTPIHRWKLPGIPPEFSVSIKREDLTGSGLSGNKVRQLEFLMAEALEQGCRHVITCGRVQSNHCRAVALASRQLGLTPHLFLRTDVTDPKRAGCEGNLLLDRVCGCDIYLVPLHSPYPTHLQPRMERLAQRISREKGEKSYIIPLGGASKASLFGYISVFEELRQQGVLDDFDDLVFPLASGGTASGLALGNYLTGAKLRLHGIAVGPNAGEFYDSLDRTLAEVGVGHVKARGLLRIADNHSDSGFGVTCHEELEFIRQVAVQTAVIVDPTYSGKAAFGMVREMQTNPAAFQGPRVLFLHTGGIFSLFDGRMASYLERREEEQPLMTSWPEGCNEPPRHG